MSEQSWPLAARETHTGKRTFVVQILLALGALAVVAAGCYALVVGALPQEREAPAVVPPSAVTWTGVVPR
ncbi:hypothetical protein BJY24_000767 [Nocardia transvalensis]|uniref:Uncharacterized protein n=1 Tax=Nocardia transvalensis TaxID=37333 RepID=A0A7W9P9I8_9NOCA|nr:hypothetical protein [Nocardia transvalensis]MBB5911900.1 hypothetical protein [Nocardia transvalensis]